MIVNRFNDNGKLDVGYLILFSIIFINILNPISPYFTLIFNLLLVTYLVIKSGNIHLKIDFVLPLLTFIILLWAIFVSILNGNLDEIVFLKYTRNLVSTILLTMILIKINLKTSQIISVFNYILTIHIFSILFQQAFPEVKVPMALFFGFERDITIVKDYTARNLGIVTGYDTASLLAVFALIYFMIQFITLKKNFFLILIIFSCAAAGLTSRSGIVLGSISVVIFNIFLLWEFNFIKKIIPLLILCCFCYFFYIYFLSFILISFGIDLPVEMSRYESINFISSNYGSDGSFKSIMSSRLDYAGAGLANYILGFGADPSYFNKPELATDVGYIKIIYHIGIIGLFLILGLYFYISYYLYKYYRLIKNDKNLKVLTFFFFIVLFFTLIMNYKSLELYSRTSYELSIIIFFVIKQILRNKNLNDKMLFNN